MRKHVKGFLSLVLSIMLVGTSFASVSAYTENVTIDTQNIKLNYLDDNAPGDYVAVSGALKSNDAVVSNQDIKITKEKYDSYVNNLKAKEEYVKSETSKLNQKSDEVKTRKDLLDSLEVGTEEYSTALENYNTILEEYKSLESAFSAKIDEFDSKEKEIIPSFTDNWNKLTLKESTDTENRYAAEPSVEYPYYVTWVKVTVNGNDYYNYSVNCIKQQEEVYVCKILDGKYYDKNGKVVSEEEYNKSCNPSCKVVDGKYYDNNGKEVSKDAYTKACGNPKTGNNMYYAYGAVIVVAACGLYMATRKVKKFSK